MFRLSIPSSSTTWRILSLYGAHGATLKKSVSPFPRSVKVIALPVPLKRYSICFPTLPLVYAFCTVILKLSSENWLLRWWILFTYSSVVPSWRASTTNAPSAFLFTERIAGFLDSAFASIGSSSSFPPIRSERSLVSPISKATVSIKYCVVLARVSTNKEKCSAVTSTAFSSSSISDSFSFSTSAPSSFKWNTEICCPAFSFKKGSLEKLTLTSPFVVSGCTSAPSLSSILISKMMDCKRSWLSSSTFSFTAESTCCSSTLESFLTRKVAPIGNTPSSACTVTSTPESSFSA